MGRVPLVASGMFDVRWCAEFLPHAEKVPVILAIVLASTARSWHALSPWRSVQQPGVAWLRCSGRFERVATFGVSACTADAWRSHQSAEGNSDTLFFIVMRLLNERLPT